MMLVDSHCHLDFKDFAEDLDAVVERARAAGVGRMLTICTKLAQFDACLAITERYDDVFLAVGVHPHEAAVDGGVTVERLVALADHPKLVGIGETGLDYYYDHSPREQQKASFRTHIRAARETELPLIVHTREADEDTIAILQEEGRGEALPPLKGIIHCFSSGAWLAEAALELGFHISFSGILTFRRSESIREVASAVPADRLLVETDAPYLSPEPLRGRRNEPAHVIHTATRLAEVRGVSRDEIARQTTDNFLNLFNKVPALPAVMP